MRTKSPQIRFPAFRDSWNEQRLGKFFTSSRVKGSEGMPTLSVTLNRGLINRDDMDRKTDTNLDADEHLLVREGDIAYNMMRMWQGAFGRASYEGIVSPAYVVLRPLVSADSGYFEYAFRRARSIYLFWAYSYGLTNDRLRLYGGDFLRIPFSAPSRPEQRKIADFLTAVDGRIQQLSQKLALLQDYKKGVMQQLFTQALRFKDDHGNDFPDWEEKTLGEVADIKTGPFGSTLHQSDYVEVGTPIITVEHLSDYGLVHANLPLVSDNDTERLKNYALRENDSVFSRVGSVDRNSVVKREEEGWLFSGRILRIRLDPRILDARFLGYYFQLDLTKYRIRSVAVGQTMASLNTEILRAFQVVTANLEEQTKIANFLTALDRKIESVAHQITHTQTFKKGLLQQMFV